MYYQRSSLFVTGKDVSKFIHKYNIIDEIE